MTGILIPASAAYEGMVLNSNPFSCGHVLEVLSAAQVTTNQGTRKVVSVGCACGAAATFTMQDTDVLSLSGTVALIV